MNQRSSNFHSRIDARSLDLHDLVAKKITLKPELLEIAKSNIQQWRLLHQDQSSKTEPYYLKEWEDIINQGVEKVCIFLRDNSEYAKEMRQSSPFAGILSDDERLEIFQKWKENS